MLLDLIVTNGELRHLIDIVYEILLLRGNVLCLLLTNHLTLQTRHLSLHALYPNIK